MSQVRHQGICFLSLSNRNNKYQTTAFSHQTIARVSKISWLAYFWKKVTDWVLHGIHHVHCRIQRILESECVNLLIHPMKNIKYLYFFVLYMLLNKIICKSNHGLSYLPLHLTQVPAKRQIPKIGGSHSRLSYVVALK